MIEGESGVETTAVEAPADDYELYSEQQAEENKPDAKPEAAKQESELPDEDEPEEGKSDDGESSEPQKKKSRGWHHKLAVKDKIIADLQQQLQQRVAPAKQNEQAVVKEADDGRPDPNNPKYQTDTGHLDYMEDLTEWKVEQRERKTSSAQEQKAFAGKLATLNAEIAQTNPQAYEVLGELNQAGLLTKPLTDAIVDSPVSKELAIHLAEYPGTITALQQLTPTQFYKAMGALEAGLMQQQGQTKEEGQEAAVRQTRATAPISPIKSSGSGMQKDPDKMSFEEYDNMRRQQEKAKYR